MKIRHIVTWIPVIGIFSGLIYGMEYDSPVQTHTLLNVAVHVIGVSILMIGCLLKLIYIYS